MGLKHLSTIPNNSYLHRYIKLDYLPVQFEKDKFLLRLSRIDQFDDPFEGWDLSNPEGLYNLIEILNFGERVIEDGGVVESLEDVLLNVYSMRGHGTKEMSIREYKDSINKYLFLRKRLFASCWYWTSEQIENRAMWETYGSDGVRITFNSEDLKTGVESCESKSFVGGRVKYKLSTSKSEIMEEKVFYKTPEYSHEKEYRLVYYCAEDSKKISFTERITINKVIITLNPYWSISKRQMITEWINQKYEKQINAGFLTVGDSNMRIGRLNTDRLEIFR